MHEAKTHLSQLVERAAAGEEIVIARAGKPAARLVPLGALPREREPGLWKGKLELPADWDGAEVNSEIETLFYGGDAGHE